MRSADFYSAGAADILCVKKLGTQDLMRNDGPWTLREGLRRSNVVLGLSGGTAVRGWSTRLMACDARWASTDPAPQRWVDTGQYNGRPFGRFDAVDATSGGRTQCSSLSAEWHDQRDDGTRTRIAGYVMRCRLDLNSNFT